MLYNPKNLEWHFDFYSCFGQFYMQRRLSTLKFISDCIFSHKISSKVKMIKIINGCIIFEILAFLKTKPDKIINMSNKIKAAIRVRPFLPSQIHNGYTNTRLTVDHQNKEIFVKDQNIKRSFHFDYLFDQKDSQEDIYTGCKIDQLIDRAIEGYHSTIFAYGQTGSGKTFTMQGAESVEQGVKTQLDGLIPKTVKSIFRKTKLETQRTFMVSVSFLQIYNEKIFDLLNPSSLNPKSLGNSINGLRMRWSKDEQFNVENLFIFECKNSEELLKYFMYGLKNRINSSHKLNMSSSRSHSILTIKIQSFHHSDPSRILSSKIQLVDLAGSQRIGLTGTQGKLAKESIDINKSLFTLRQVISILAEAGKNKNKDKGHVPYRDSKLTSILKQSIGGNSYCLMIACINPNDTFMEENLSTLTYATKASYITNKPTINDDPRTKLITDLRKQIKQLNQELGKANQHIQMMGTFNKNSAIDIKGGGNRHWNQNSQKLHEDSEESQSIPNPVFNRKLSERSNHYDQFSQRLVESINMVRQLLKSNKQLREQLEESNSRLQEKDIELYELSRENQFLKEKYNANSESFRTDSPEGKRSAYFRNKNITGPKMNITNPLIQTSNISNLGNTNGKNSFNYWNSVEINQYYINEKGIDSMPTNFNKRESNSAQNTRVLQSRLSSSDRAQRHAITAKSMKRNWMSKNSEPKKFLSFYNDPNKEDPVFY